LANPSRYGFGIKNQRGTVAKLVPEGVEALYNRVKQSPRLDVSVWLFSLLYFETSTFQAQVLANADMVNGSYPVIIFN
jgi:hypothetical protein